MLTVWEAKETAINYRLKYLKDVRIDGKAETNIRRIDGKR